MGFLSPGPLPGGVKDFWGLGGLRFSGSQFRATAHARLLMIVNSNNVSEIGAAVVQQLGHSGERQLGHRV